MRDENQIIKKRALFLTFITNILFFLFLMIVVAWKETYPPPEEYGIELGLESISETESVEDDDSDLIDNQENTPLESIESNNDINSDNNNETNNDTENDAYEENLVQEEIINNELESEIVNEEKSQKNEINDQINQNNNNSSDSSSINKESIQNEIIDERAIFNSKKSGGTKGSSLDMQGWVWDFEPNPSDNSSESGRIIFEIIVDYYGEIIGLKTLETTVSPIVENIYKEEVLKLTFSPTNNNNPADISKGKITFIIKNN